MPVEGGGAASNPSSGVTEDLSGGENITYLEI